MQRPILLISACLEFEKVRYNGQLVLSKIIRDLVSHVDFIKVCPEYEIGLGVPREPIRIVKKGDTHRLIQHKTNRDITDEMDNFSRDFARKLGDVDGFIFKSKSPSMGVSNIKVYSGMKGSPVVDRCGGFFAGRILEKYRNYPVEEEDRLRNKKIRDHFLTRIYLFADYRVAKRRKRLKDFNDRNNLLLDFYGKGAFRKLDFDSDKYFETLKKNTRIPPKNEEIASFFEKIIGEKEGLISRYRENKISYETLKEVSKFLIKDRKLLKQTFFNLYPEDLLANAEDDRGRDYWKNS